MTQNQHPVRGEMQEWVESRWT